MPTKSIVTPRRSLFLRYGAAIAGAAGTLCAVGAASADVSITTVLLQSTQAPGQDPGVTMGGGFFPPALEPVGGRAVFLGFLAGPGVNVGLDDSVVLGGDLAALTTIARADRPAQAVEAGTVYDGFNSVSVAGGDKVAFTSLLFGPAVVADFAAIFHGNPGSLTVAMRQATQATGAPAGVLFAFRTADTAPGQADSTFSSLRLGGGGHVAFITGLSGPVTVGGTNPTDAGIWGGLPGSVTKIARRGDQAPGVDVGLTYLNVLAPVVTPSGNMAYVAQLAGPGVVAGVNRAGIWAGPMSSPTKVIRGGEPAPGLPGLTIRGFNEPTMNDANIILWRGSFDGPGVIPSTPPPPEGTFANDSALFYGPAGNMQPLCRIGEPAPLINEPTSILTGFSLGVVNAPGIAAFVGVLTGPGITLNLNDEVLYSGTPGNLRVVSRAGMPAPEAEAGVTIAGFSDVCLNASGKMLAVIFLSGPGITTEVNDQMLVLIDSASSVMTPLARRGALLEVAPGDSRTIDDIGLFLNSGGQDGRRTSLTNDGRAAFTIAFLDGSIGMFVATAVTGCNAADVAGLGGTIGPDGAHTPDDIIVFLGAFFAENRAVADIARLGGAPGSDGLVTPDDLIFFLAEFFLPCP